MESVTAMCEFVNSRGNTAGESNPDAGDGRVSRRQRDNTMSSWSRNAVKTCSVDA